MCSTTLSVQPHGRIHRRPPLAPRLRPLTRHRLRSGSANMTLIRFTMSCHAWDHPTRQPGRHLPLTQVCPRRRGNMLRQARRSHCMTCRHHPRRIAGNARQAMPALWYRGFYPGFRRSSGPTTTTRRLPSLSRPAKAVTQTLHLHRHRLPLPRPHPLRTGQLRATQ